MKQVVKTRAFQDRLKGHKDGVITLFAPEGPQSGTLYSASKDGCVRAWDLIERKITTKLLVSRIPNETVNDYDHLNQELDGNMDERQEVKGIDTNKKAEQEQGLIDQLSASAFSLQSIYGAFQDGIICAWNLRSGEMVHKLEGHTDKVTCLKFLNPRLLISSSYDSTIRSWDVMTGASETVYKMAGKINLMDTSSQYIYAIINKNTFYELNSESFKVTRCIQFCFTSITSFIIHANQLIFGTINNTMEIYNLQTLNEQNIQPTKIIESNNGWILSMKILDQYLYTGGDDRRIQVWDLEKDMTNVQDLNGHEDGVISLEFADGMLYTGSFDHMILSWDLKEMYNRIRERSRMFKQDVASRKYEAWYKTMYKQKKKGKKGKKGKQK